MPAFAGRRVTVFHAGALGDFVLVWPLLRALRSGGATVCVVAAPSHAELAEHALGVRGLSGERGWVTALWREGESLPALRGTDAPDAAHADVAVSFVTDEGDAAGRTWCISARRVLGAGQLICAGPPGSESRKRLWALAEVAALGDVPLRVSPSGPIVLHTGAGSRDKSWPMARWAELAGALQSRGRTVRVIAGHVENERFDGETRRVFASLAGDYVGSLADLAGLTRAASLFIGADTGPTHLAAQLGVPTIALFGPTDPAVWSPAGPGVAVIQAPRGRMRELRIEAVLAALGRVC